MTKFSQPSQYLSIQQSWQDSFVGMQSDSSYAESSFTKELVGGVARIGLQVVTVAGLASFEGPAAIRHLQKRKN